MYTSIHDKISYVKLVLLEHKEHFTQEDFTVATLLMGNKYFVCKIVW